MSLFQVYLLFYLDILPKKWPRESPKWHSNREMLLPDRIVLVLRIIKTNTLFRKLTRICDDKIKTENRHKNFNSSKPNFNDLNYSGNLHVFAFTLIAQNCFEIRIEIIFVGKHQQFRIVWYENQLFVCLGTKCHIIRPDLVSFVFFFFLWFK